MAPFEEHGQQLQPAVYQSGLELAPEQTAAGKPGLEVVAPQQTRTILGLRRTTFALALTLLVVVVAATVGGGVGGSLAVQRAKDSAQANGPIATVTVTITTTPIGRAATSLTSSAGSTATSSAIVAPTGVLALDCPGLNSEGEQVVTLGTRSWRFTVTCGTDHVGYDIGAVIVYSFRDCLQACAAHNHFSGEDRCVAVEFNANMTPAISQDYGDCWLKNGTAAEETVSSNLLVGAVLSSSG